MSDKEYRDWWKEVYIASIRAGRHPEASKDCADEAVRHLKALNPEAELHDTVKTAYHDKIVQEAMDRVAKLNTENERLTLRATAVVEDNYLCKDRKPNATDSYGVNAVLLWLLRKEVSDE